MLVHTPFLLTAIFHESARVVMLLRLREGDGVETGNIEGERFQEVADHLHLPPVETDVDVRSVVIATASK